MLTKPSPAVLRALTALKIHTGGDVIEFLEAELSATHELLAEAQEDWRLRRWQGRAQFIKEFLALVRTASA